MDDRLLHTHRVQQARHRHWVSGIESKLFDRAFPLREYI